MESGNSGASNKGVLVPVSASSDLFQNKILAPLKSAYLYEESKQSFRYKSAAIIKNPALEEKYNAFQAKRREVGYSEEDLKETYGFLLFDDVNKANAIGETGVLTGNSTCTTLGDPSKGVYISMYSDCLDPNRWYHGKSGYIAIIRLTKGRVNKVIENYTQNFTTPTEGFDCHVSEQLPSVSAKTSSFLAFERTQYYVYELLDGGSNETTPSPSAACPFAIISFSYTDTKATLVEPLERSEEKKLVCQYFPWRGQFQIGTGCYDFGLRSTEGALIPAELPPVVKVDQAISMSDLRQLLPTAVFETCFSGEVFLDGLYCSLCELVSSKAEQSSSLSLLLSEIKEKDVALIIPLNDGGFLILLHSSHFLTYDDNGSSAAVALQSLFVFPDSRAIQRETRLAQRKLALSSEILRVLPVLSYAEGEIEKTSVEPSEELCEVFTQHMKSYAALITPGLALSPSRDSNIFPDQYDVPDAHKHLYLSPEWTNRAWQSFTSYLNKPVCFQLPVSKASEIMAAGQEERIEDLDDDVYFCPSSPEEAISSNVGMASEDQPTGLESAVNVETVADRVKTSAEAQVDITAVPQNVLQDYLRQGNFTKDSKKSDLTALVKTDNVGTKNVLTPSTSDDLPTELIVSITSAEQATDASLSNITAESTIKHNDFQVSGFSTARFETVGVSSLNGETAVSKNVFDCAELPSLSKRKRRKLRRRLSKHRKPVSKACRETSSLETVKVPVEDGKFKSQKEGGAEELSRDFLLSNSSNNYLRKLRGRKIKFGSSENKKVRSATVGLVVTEKKTLKAGQQSFGSTILMELEAFPLRRKTERWDLKPVISECGRILVPHGSADIVDQIKTLKDKLQSTKDEPCPEKVLVDISVNAHVTVEMEQDSSTVSETTVDETEATTSKTEGNHLPVDPEHNILSDDQNGSLTLNPEKCERSLINDGADIPLKTAQEKHTGAPSLGKLVKGELLLNKLKSVLSRKRTTGIRVLEEKTAESTQDTEPCLKKGRVDSDSAVSKTNDEMTIVHDTNLGVKEVSKMLSVDPLFAYALGLTPKEATDTMRKTDGQDTKQRTHSSEPQEQTILDKKPQIIQRPLPIFPRRGRIKTLKKHQGISAEYVKKKWWLHFQTPSCFASEKVKCKESSRSNSVRETVKEKSNSDCSSTEGLNLLADLALSANVDQVPLQPDRAQEKPETSLKKCDLTNVTGGEQESVLHALLRQPTVRPIQPLKSPPPSHLVGGSELVGVISKEHAYSLPPSSSLLLGLSGAPFQISPLSGSTRLLHHHQKMFGDGSKTLHPSVYQEDISEHNHRTQEHLIRHMVHRRKFRHTRTFVNKDGSVQITKQWKENYDFNLDSKFSTDSKDKAIIRALHGPWDYSIQDTNEEMRLIIHMWIGLFYSRSTARFFHFDSNLTNLCSGEAGPLEMSSGMVSAPAQSELKASSVASYLNEPDTSDTSISKALDLSKKDKCVLDQESMILDLSLRNSNAEIVTSDPQVQQRETSVFGEQKEAKETLNTVKSSVGLQKGCRNSVHSTEITNEVNKVRSNYEVDRTIAPLQKAGYLEQTDAPSRGGGTLISAQGETERDSVQLENHQTALETDDMLQGCSNKKIDKKDGTKNSDATKMTLLQNQDRDSSKPATDKEVDSSEKESDVMYLNKHDKIESKDEQNLEVEKKTYQERDQELSSKVSYPSDDSTKKESGIICNGNLLEEQKQLPREEPKAVSPGKAENVNEDVDCCLAHDNKAVKDDPFGKGVLDGNDRHTLGMEADSYLIEQPLPMMCDGQDTVQEDYNGEAPMDEQPPRADYGEDSCHDLLLRKLDSTLTDEHTIPVVVPQASSETEPVHTEPAVEENSENDICLADLNYPPLPTCDSPDLLKKDCITKCSRQAPLDEQPPRADYAEDSCHDLLLRKLDSTLTDEHTIPEVVPQASSETEPVHTEPAVEENSENDICLADLNYPPLPTCDSPDLLKKDCIAKCSRQAPLDEQPPPTDNKGHALHNLQLCENSSASTDESTSSEIAPLAPSEMEPIHTEPEVGENAEKYICLANEAHNQKAASPVSDESTCLVDGSSSDGSIPQTSGSVEKGSQNKGLADLSLKSDDHEDQDTTSVEEEQYVDNSAQKELLHHWSHSPQCVAVPKCDAEVAPSKETGLKSDKTKEGKKKNRSRVVIPFIGVDISEEDASHSEGEVEGVHDPKETSFISGTTYPETVLPTEVYSKSQMNDEKAELTTNKISLSPLDVSKTNQPQVSGSESDDRCPTPTIDEEPYQCEVFSDPSRSSSSSSSSSSSVFSGSETFKNKSLISRKDEMVFVPKHRPTKSSDSSSHHHPDLELRTLRVLQSIDKFLSSSNHTDKTSQIKTVDIKHSLDQPHKIQEISLGQDCHSHRSFASSEHLQADKSNIHQDRDKTTSQTSLSHEPHLYIPRPVMAVKPSKSEEVQADCISKGREMENSVTSDFSKNQQKKTPVFTYTTPSSVFLEKRTESFKGNSTGLNDYKHQASKLSSKSSRLSNVSESHSDLAKFAPLDTLYQCKRSDVSEFNQTPLPWLPVKSFQSAKTSSKLLDGSQSFIINSQVEKVVETNKASIEMNQKDCSDASTSGAYYEDDVVPGDSLFPEPRSSLTCTVLNTSRKRSASFLEQISQRCLQDDLTLASMEQECLIFSEQMKQLLKRSKMGPIHHLNSHDNLNLSCSSPLTVHFSSLEEPEDSVDHVNAPSLDGLKIRVDMSDRKDQADTTERENTSSTHPKKLSQETKTPVEHAGVLGVTAECARLYTAMMNDVCAVKKVPSRPKQFGMDRGYVKTEQSNHFDFCDQMKRDMDDSFRSNLNSVVKKCSKTKYRFYIVVTSDDCFFRETEAQLRAEGHTAVQPSEFFVGGKSSSSLLIILRNEDIAEHICEVPHLLELKKSPDVQFAGIDERDDVVNLCHQELFIRGGFIMFDKAALESLSLCNMKRLSEILLELSKTGKWKWMFHYRDSRRLKENARLSAEAKEKKHFLNWCQDTGILEVLPYHECDLTSRDQPDYLTCLVRLQVQNISARYPVFITDTRTESTFGTNGILTMTVKSLLTCSPSETFRV